MQGAKSADDDADRVRFGTSANCECKQAHRTTRWPRFRGLSVSAALQAEDIKLEIVTTLLAKWLGKEYLLCTADDAVLPEKS